MRDLIIPKILAAVFVLMLVESLPATAQNAAYLKLTAADEPYGIVEITDFTIGAIPVYNSMGGEPVDYIRFSMRDFDNGRFYSTSAQNGLKFYPYQLWQGEEVAAEVRDCGVAAVERYLLQLSVVGDVSGRWLKVVTHFAFGCPANIDGMPMYIPYSINNGEKVSGALDYDEYFLIEYQPEFMRLRTWEELFRTANAASNYGGIEVYAEPDGKLLDATAFGDTLRIVSEPQGAWVMIEALSGAYGWIKWREGSGLHPQIHALGPNRYDEYAACLEVVAD